MASRSKHSAGLMAYRFASDDPTDLTGVEVLIVHPGGPFWKNKDDGAWSIPKGEYNPATEDALEAARREFGEETGTTPPDDGYEPLGSVTLKSRKQIAAWAIAVDLDADAIVSNTFTMEWPPKSGKQVEFSEVDRAAWCSPDVARQKLNPAQAELVDRLLDYVSGIASGK